ncbi:unnamed protein product [Nyctereutes procyonoides]|uniref:(raccoon dog) hypothetical protein n=1 Tax=Nyctereutes procyonoides TaxID=34880 RepID=A0A811Z458_NYCPR|nr:unnamed protein product [Nyctereutes procyonoides]
MVQAIRVPNMLEQPPASVEHPASALEQHPESHQEAALATIVGPTEASGPEVIEPVKAAGVECLPGAEMAPVESKPLQVLVTPLIHCPQLEVPPAPLAPPKRGQASVPTLEFIEGPVHPPALLEQPASATEQQLIMATVQRKASPPLSLRCV